MQHPAWESVQGFPFQQFLLRYPVVDAVLGDTTSRVSSGAGAAFTGLRPLHVISIGWITRRQFLLIPNFWSIPHQTCWNSDCCVVATQEVIFLWAGISTGLISLWRKPWRMSCQHGWTKWSITLRLLVLSFHCLCFSCKFSSTNMSSPRNKKKTSQMWFVRGNVPILTRIDSFQNGYLLPCVIDKIIERCKWWTEVTTVIRKSSVRLVSPGMLIRRIKKFSRYSEVFNNSDVDCMDLFLFVFSACKKFFCVPFCPIGKNGGKEENLRNGWW